MKNKIEFGLMTFGDMQPESDKSSGKQAFKRIQDLMQEIKTADRLGIDVFGVGEHHREDYAISNPATLLAAAASITENIKLTSAVTVLSSDDPVRVYQQFATLDLISNGRAEIMAGRGSFIESFPLFGFNLNDYNELFEEKIDLLNIINSSEIINWKGKHRSPIENICVYPKPKNGKIPIWIAAGGSPESAIRAAQLNLPLMLAIIGGLPENFVPFIQLYKNQSLKLGIPENEIQIGINNHVFIGEDDSKIADDFFPYYADMMDRVGRSRGWQPMSRAQYEWMRNEKGSLMVGSVEKVVDKIAYEYKLFGFTRFFAQASLGFVPHELTMKSIELYATEVIPRVKKKLGFDDVL